MTVYHKVINTPIVYIFARGENPTGEKNEGMEKLGKAERGKNRIMDWKYGKKEKRIKNGKIL